MNAKQIMGLTLTAVFFTISAVVSAKPQSQDYYFNFTREREKN